MSKEKYVQHIVAPKCDEEKENREEKKTHGKEV